MLTTPSPGFTTGRLQCSRQALQPDAYNALTRLYNRMLTALSQALFGCFHFTVPVIPSTPVDSCPLLRSDGLAGPLTGLIPAMAQLPLAV